MLLGSQYHGQKFGIKKNGLHKRIKTKQVAIRMQDYNYEKRKCKVGGRTHDCVPIFSSSYTYIINDGSQIPKKRQAIFII